MIHQRSMGDHYGLRFSGGPGGVYGIGCICWRGQVGKIFCPLNGKRLLQRVYAQFLLYFAAGKYNV